MAYFDQAFGGGAGGAGAGGLDLQSLLASLRQGGGNGMLGGPQLPSVTKAPMGATAPTFPGAPQPAQTNPTAQLEMLQKLLAGNTGGGGLASLFQGLGGIGAGGGIYGAGGQYGGSPYGGGMSYGGGGDFGSWSGR